MDSKANIDKLLLHLDQLLDFLEERLFAQVSSPDEAKKIADTLFLWDFEGDLENTVLKLNVEQTKEGFLRSVEQKISAFGTRWVDFLVRDYKDHWISRSDQGVQLIDDINTKFNQIVDEVLTAKKLYSQNPAIKQKSFFQTIRYRFIKNIKEDHPFGKHKYTFQDLQSGRLQDEAINYYLDKGIDLEDLFLEKESIQFNLQLREWYAQHNYWHLAISEQYQYVRDLLNSKKLWDNQKLFVELSCFLTPEAIKEVRSFQSNLYSQLVAQCVSYYRELIEDRLNQSIDKTAFVNELIKDLEIVLQGKIIDSFILPVKYREAIISSAVKDLRLGHRDSQSLAWYPGMKFTKENQMFAIYYSNASVIAEALSEILTYLKCLVANELVSNSEGTFSSTLSEEQIEQLHKALLTRFISKNTHIEVFSKIWRGLPAPANSEKVIWVYKSKSKATNVKALINLIKLLAENKFLPAKEAEMKPTLFGILPALIRNCFKSDDEKSFTVASNNEGTSDAYDDLQKIVTALHQSPK